ncbi:MAG: universal stress protein [Chloroflexota bacterium]
MTLDAIQNPIVCATRGGEGSLAVQSAAIKRAKQEKKPLVFLFVTDPLSVSDYAEGLAEAVELELNWMGETMLRLAQRRADDEDVLSEVRVRQGEVKEEISRFLQESNATLLLLGAPRGTTANVFGDDAVERFAIHVQEKAKIPVEIIRPELA